MEVAVNMDGHNRLAGLDYLRGLAALGIMLFHYTMWTMGVYTAADLLGRVGIYGVVVFYMLSGITLYHVYYGRLGVPGKKGLADFAIKRVARIYPLLWLMTAATLLIKREDFPVETILLNVTGLFGVYHWGDTVCYGAWSIGNELVFYLFFPVFVLLGKRWRMGFVALCSALLLVYIWYTFVVMDPALPLSGATWIPFINPLNQVSYFLAGYLIAHFTKGRDLRGFIAPCLLVAGVLAFIFYPVHDDAMHLVAGWNRVVFTVICGMLCLAMYKGHFRLPGLLHRFFSMLGEISYGVYLAHPLVTYVQTKVLHRYVPGLPLPAVITANCCMTLVVAWVIYRAYERPFMRLGQYLSGKSMA